MSEVTKKDKANTQAGYIIVKINALTAEREEFDAAFVRSNAMLYKLLANVMTIYLDAKNEEGVLSETVLRMKKSLQKESERIQVNTSNLGIFVRYVFRSDRQRTYNYVRCIEAAIQKGITADLLPQFIEDSGGIEACKKQVIKSSDTVERERQLSETIDDIERALKQPDLKTIATVQTDQMIAEAVKNQPFVLLLGKPSGNSVNVIHTVPGFSKGIENWVVRQLAMFAQQHKTELDAARLQQRSDETTSEVLKEATPVDVDNEIVAE